MLKAIFFDFGETIATPDPSFQEFLQKFIIKSNGEISQQAITSVLQNAEKRYLRDYPSNDEQELKCFWLNLYSEVLRYCKIDDNRTQMISEEMWNEHLRPDSYRIFPDVIPCLQELSNKGIDLGILSNFDQSLRQKIKHFGIGEFFQYVYISTEIKMSKPNPDVYLLICEKLGIKREELLYIGDSISTDYVPCSKLGIDCLIIDRENKCDANVPRISSLYEISERIKE